MFAKTPLSLKSTGASSKEKTSSSLAFSSKKAGATDMVEVWLNLSAMLAHLMN